MDKETNIAPLLRYAAMGLVLLIGVPLLLILRHEARFQPLPGLVAMGVVTAFVVGLILLLRSDAAVNAVIKLPQFKKKDTFVS